MGIFLEVFDEQDTSMRLARTSQTTILQSDVCISDEILGHLIGSRMQLAEIELIYVKNIGKLCLGVVFSLWGLHGLA